MKRTICMAAVMASALSLSAPATAGFFDFTLAPYVGASIGQGSADISCPTSVSCDDTDTAWKVYGGLEMNEYISMEVGYANMGTTDYSGALSGTRETTGVTVQLVGTYALNPSFTLIGKGGFGILGTEVKGTIAPGAATTVDDTDLEWSLGLGAQYNFNKSVGLRVEWERYFEVGSPAADGTGEADIDLVTAGLVFKF